MPSPVSAQDLDLHGTIDHSQADSYVLVPFELPAGIQRLDVSFSYTGKENHTTLDLGLLDPERFRGWSGGNKHFFSVGIADATPSYLPGPLPEGTWNLLIGVAHLEGGQTSQYKAHIHFIMTNEVDTSGFTSAPIATGAHWYRGDLHMHTAHSDGSCRSQSGMMVPRPVFVTVEQAVKQQLDFIAITDHNTVSHYDAERELQPYFDRILLIPGREITTYSGHANVFGPTRFIDFRSEAKGAASINDVFRDAQAAGAFVSVNHPGDPTGASCFGCSWSVMDTDWNLVNGVEAIDGEDPHHYEADIRFWDHQLAKGYRLVCHRWERYASTGAGYDRPSDNSRACSRAFSARHPCCPPRRARLHRPHCVSRQAHRSACDQRGCGYGMGGTLSVPGNERVTLTAHVTGASGSTLHWLLDGKEISSLPSESLTAASADEAAGWTSDGQRHWIRVEVRTPEGTLELLSNPVFLNWRTS